MYPSSNTAIAVWEGEGKPWNLVPCTFKQTSIQSLRQICDQRHERERDVHLPLKPFQCLDFFSSSGVLKARVVVEAEECIERSAAGAVRGAENTLA